MDSILRTERDRRVADRTKAILLADDSDRMCKDMIVGGDCRGSGKPHHLLIKNFAHNVKLIPATIADYSTIQNMARFYVYDRTAYMDWECPESGLFECIDFKHYFENSDEKAFLIRYRMK